MHKLSLSACTLLVAALPCFAQSASDRFQQMDANRDGLLSKGEFDSDDAFKDLDADHNNRLSAKEIDALLGPQADGMPSSADRIRRVDRNNDGELDSEELRRGAETRFEWLDRNDDGSIDLDELKSGFGIPVGAYVH